MNEHAFEQIDAWGYRYASDGRGQLRDDGALPIPAPARTATGPDAHPDADHAADARRTARRDRRRHRREQCRRASAEADGEPARDHVFTLHAELEGQKLAPIFEQLLSGWKAQGYQLASMADYYEKIKRDPLPEYPVQWGEMPGRSGELIILDTMK